MFRIEFESDELRAAGGVSVGSIVIGSFRERFEASLDFWEEADYEEHWLKAIRRLVDGAASTALITQLHDPAQANFIVWWPIYRVDAVARFHNQLLMLEDLDTTFDLGDIYRHIPPYGQTNEDGERISEWSVSLVELESFVGG